MTRTFCGKLVGSSCLAAVLLATAACDGAIGIKGRVFAAPPEAKNSSAIMEQPDKLDLGLSPLEGATVKVYSESNYRKLSDGSEPTPLLTANTDGEGRFRARALTAPFRFNVVLEVRKDGYKTLVKTFLHDRSDDHVAVIMLVAAGSATDKVAGQQ